MPLDAEKLDELKANIAFARKRPLAFGLCLGKSAETTVLLNHKTKDPETLGRLAKKEGETTKLAFGMMTVEAKNVNLSCVGDVVPGLARKAKEMLKAAGLKMKVRILDAEGNLLEENGDDEDEDENPDVGLSPDDPPDPQQEKWTQVRPRVQDALGRTGADGKIDLTQARATWQTAQALAEADDFAGAMQAAAATVRQIAAAVEAGRAVEAGPDAEAGRAVEAGPDVEAERARWQAVAAKLRPVMEGLGGAQTPENRKLAAYWSFAQSKALAPVPDFAAAFKTAALLVKLIREVSAKAAVAPESKAPETASPAPKGPVSGAPPVTADENARLAALSDEELAKADLTLGDPKVLFSNKYMLDLKDAKFKGEGNPDLKKLMSEIANKGVAGKRRTEVMLLLEQIVGVPPDKDRLDDDYGRFVVVQKQQAAIGKQKKKEDVPPLDEKEHPDFMASRSQLMFGKVLGNAFGIHEIFASLLSSTGGLVGSGNDSLHLSPDNPIALHGTVHDAAGYLSSYHTDGPGYNYLESWYEDLVFENMPLPDYLAGQISGIRFWVKEAGQGKSMAYWLKEAGLAYAENKATEVLVEIEKQLKSARDAVAAEIDRQIAEAKRLAEQAVELARELADAAVETARGVADAIMGAKSKVEESAVEVLDTATKNIGEVKDEAKRKLEAAWDFIWS